MDTLTDLLSTSAEELVQLVPQLSAAILVFLLLTMVGRTLAKLVERFRRNDGRRNGRHAARSTHLLRRGVRIAFDFVGVVLALQILGLTAVATSLLATGGLVAVVLGFAFREIGENLLAGIFLGVSRSFEVGDLIESGGWTGKVREIDLRQVWIRSADGRDIFIPSAQIFRNVLVNYTRDGLRRGDFLVGLDYGEDIPEARRLLLRTAKKITGVLTDPAATVRVADFQANYCELQVFFWVDVDTGPGLGEVRSEVMNACLGALKGAGFTLSSDVSTAVSVSQAGG